MTEWTPTQKKRFLLLVGASCALVALDVAFPGKYEVVPPWKIQVVDSKGAPIPGAELQQTCTRFFGAYRVELKALTAKTGEDGTATLPQRDARSPRLSVWLGRLAGVLNVHSSYGSISTTWASKDGFEPDSVGLGGQETSTTNGTLYSRLKLSRGPADKHLLPPTFESPELSVEL